MVEFVAIESPSTKKMVETIKVIADYSVDNVGGVAHDQALAALLAKKFNEMPSRKGKKPLE